jgi:hypothetical protein
MKAAGKNVKLQEPEEPREVNPTTEMMARHAKIRGNYFG